MNELMEIASIHLEDLLREAVSRQSPLELTYRLESGWVKAGSRFLGLDRSSGDLVTAWPSCPQQLSPELVDGQTIGVSFRRASRKCMFETVAAGRCLYSSGGDNDVPALRLLWPDDVIELQRRLYYRTPVPRDIYLPVQVRLWDPDYGAEEDRRPLRGRMLNISAGGLSLALKPEDNPRWQTDTRIMCSFVAAPGEPPVEIYSHLRHLDECPDGSVHMGVHFMGLEATSENRRALQQVLELTRCFQGIEMRRQATMV